MDQVCEHAEIVFSIGADEWVSVKGTDLKAIPVGTFATEVKQSRLLTYLSDVARGDENLVKQMKYNGACEWMGGSAGRSQWRSDVRSLSDYASNAV